DRLETGELPGIRRVPRRGGAGEVRHDEAKRDLAREGRVRRERGGRGGIEAEARHAAVHLKHGRKRRSLRACEAAPALDLTGRIEDGQEARFRAGGFAAGVETVEDGDGGIRAERVRHVEGLAKLRDEKGAASLGMERRR